LFLYPRRCLGSIADFHIFYVDGASLYANMLYFEGFAEDRGTIFTKNIYNRFFFILLSIV
jgi:hypothetical protein